MSRTKKFFYNALSSMIMQIVVLIAGLITPRLMLVTYGSEINGLISSLTQFIGYFALVEAGLAGASIYALYKPLADNDATEISGVVSATSKFYRSSGFIFLALVLGMSIIYPIFVKTTSLSSVEVAFLVLVLSIGTALNFFALARYRALITADQRGYVLNILSSVSTIVNTVIIVIMTSLGADIIVLRIVALASVIISPIALRIYARIRYPFVDYKAEPNKKALNKRWDVLILQLLGSIQTALPIVLATFFTSLKQVSVYAIFNMVIMGVRSIISIFGSGVSASFGELLAKKDYTTFKKAYSEFECLSYFIITLMLSCTMVLLMPFIQLYTKGITDTNYNQTFIGFLFVINAFLYSVKSPQGTIVSSAGLFKETKWRTLLQATIAFVMGGLLAKPYGLVGILIGLILSNIYRDIDLIIFIPKTVGNIELKTTVKRVIIMFAEFALVSIPFSLIDMKITNYVQWIGWALVVFIYALIIISGISLSFDRTTFLALIKRGTGFLKMRISNG